MKHEKKLGELAATAICGNDITSSCLYVSALSIMYAGQYAWLSLLIVSVILFFYRKIYSEAVGALPLNGGAYNILLNTTSKNSASIAAVLTILSYMATAVISSSEAMHYLHNIVPSLNIFWSTITLLFLFMLLLMMGIKESSGVAIFIFIFHLTSLILLLFTVVWFLATHNLSVLYSNFKLPVKGSILSALFFGFSAAMLGISGFESSANFVEEQEKGVFRKTLRNMWLAVSIFNPLIALAIIAVLPLGVVGENQESLLSYLGNQTAGSWMGTLISIDAVMVLSGAVLTSFIGVSGLMKRMTLDRILPQFFLKENTSGGSPRIIVLFFILCISVLLITNGELGSLAGLYTISFLLVMTYFGYGNILLKIKRAKLPRPESAKTITIILAMLATSMAVYGNIILHPIFLIVFLQYFIPSMVIIYLLLNRKQVLQQLLIVLKDVVQGLEHSMKKVEILLNYKIHNLTKQQFVYFSKGDDISQLNKAIQYVEANEITRKLKIVTLVKETSSVSDSFLKDLEVLDRAYPDIDIEFVQKQGEFKPEVIEQLSKDWKIPTNFMFISSPGNRFTYKIEQLNGVRLIM
jgi:amino acid transporter